MSLLDEQQGFGVNATYDSPQLFKLHRSLRAAPQQPRLAKSCWCWLLPWTNWTPCLKMLTHGLAPR
eukprot:3634156-Amphidinium_carterae.1